MNKYHKKFLECYSSENIIGLFSRYRGASKEVTESWAMLEAANAYVNDLDQWHVIVVGDGCSPRTGALFAYLTKCDVTSVDPAFNMVHWKEHVDKQTGMGFPPQRLEVLAAYIKDVKVDCQGRSVLVLWPHSHANMNECNPINATARIDIAMPCCVDIPRGWMLKPHITYDDTNVESPKRTIHVWRDNLS